MWNDGDVAPWTAGYSYGANVDVNNTNPVHSGAKSIAFTAAGDYSNGLSFAIPFASGDANTATYPVLHFWIHGGATGGQNLGIKLVRSDDPGETEIPLGIGTIPAPAANTWTEVSIDLTAPPFSYNGAYDRFDIFTGDGTDQAIVYFDDVELTQSGPPPAVSPISAQHDVSAPATAPAGERMTSDVITWYDSKGEVRKATLAHDSNPVGGAFGVAMREFQYQLSNAATRTARYTTYGNGGFGGFGYVTDHSSRYAGCAGDDSPLGLQYALVPVTGFQRVWEGRHHAIYRMTQNYHRNCPTDIAVTPYAIPVTYDWIFSTGHDSPVYAITHNVDQMFRISNGAPVVGSNHFYDDTRAPYGELGIDGEGFTDLSGVAWGDYYKFTSDPDASRLTMATSWDWVNTNTIPFITEWIKSADVNHDAEMGLVQTQTNAQQDAAGARDPDDGSDIRPLWGTASGGVACAGLVGTTFPCGNDWPYQALGNSLEYEWTNGANLTHGTNNARLTWKTQYGFIGQRYDAAAPDPNVTGYALNDQKNGSSGRGTGYPKKSYSVYIVLGEHSVNPNPVDEQIAYVDAIQNMTLSTTTGSVVTSGPAGVTRADSVTYQPAGYNHVYGALAFSAGGNQLDANIAVGNAKTLKKPVIIVSNYSGAEPTVRFGGTLLVADADYFASLRPAASELWITLNRNLSGATNHLQINVSSCTAFGAPTGVTATVTGANSVSLSWVPVCTADSYIVERESLVANGFDVTVGQPTTTTKVDNGAAADTAYLYRVRAVSGVTESANSDSVLATTVVFTDPNLVGVVIKKDHMDELRAAVSAVHYLGTGATVAVWPPDDPINTSTTIKAQHILALRSKLDEGLAGIGFPTGGYSAGAATGQPVKALHFEEIRDRVN